MLSVLSIFYGAFSSPATPKQKQVFKESPEAYFRPDLFCTLETTQAWAWGKGKDVTTKKQKWEMASGKCL